MINIYNNTVHGAWVTEPVTDTQYCIEETDDIVTIKIQGSISFQDWLQNFSFWKKPYKHMEHLFFVHAGFLKKYKAIQEAVMLASFHASVHRKKIIVLGYSQGAAIALLLVEDIKFCLPSADVECYVFGSPRVFSIVGSKILKERLSTVIRVENVNDIVTRIPFVWMLYKHYGKLVHIGKKRRWFIFSVKDHLTYKEHL